MINRSLFRQQLVVCLLTALWMFIAGQGVASALAPPYPVAPANGGNDSGPIISFRWSQVADANDYYLKVAADAGFSDIVYIGWVGNSIGVDMSGFADDGQRYYWKVAAGNDYEVSNYSPIWSVVNGPSAPPATPTLNSPANGGKVNGGTIQFNWNPATRAADYRLQVAADSGFTDIVLDDWAGGSYTGWGISGFGDDGQQYYWRVQAWNSAGYSSYSPIWSVVNGPSAPPAVPTLSSPANGGKVNGSTIQFSWNPAARAADYRLQIAADSGFTEIVLDDWAGGPYTGWGISGFGDDGQQYYWRVQAWNSAGYSSYSPIWSVVNGPSAPPAVPTLSSPANGGKVNGGTIQFSWNPAARAADYRLQVAADSGFADIVFDDWVGGPYTGWGISGFFDDGQEYYWRVMAWNSLGTSSYSTAWSLVNGPSAPPAAPTLNSPINGSNVSGDKIAFRWNAAARADDYFLEISANAEFTEIVFGQWVGNYSGLDLGGFWDNGRQYYWRVAASNSLGISPDSAAWSLVNGPSAVPAAPTLSSPANGGQVNGEIVEFRWNPAARADNYYLEIAVDAGFADIVFGQWIGNYVGIDVSGFWDDGQQYYWRVAARNSLGVSSDSAAWSLVNGPGAIPAAPTLRSPADGDMVGGQTVQFRWSPTVSANDYYIEVAYDAGFSFLAFNGWIGNYIGIDLDVFFNDGKKYFWRVAARNQLGWSAYSDGWYFINKDYGDSCNQPEVGAGYGLLGSQTHIDICDDGNKFLLFDVSRRLGQTQHSHFGIMGELSAIETREYYFYLMEDPDKIWDYSSQESGVDAHVYAGKVYDYLWSRFNLNSYNNLGSSMVSVVEDPSDDNNASWWGGGVTYYIGSGQKSFAGALDVVAHEWAHGVTEKASWRGRKLDYEYESGALNEAFSDWMGIAVEQANNYINWKIGEKINTLRNLADPHAAYRPQPDFYKELNYWVPTENCTPQKSNDRCGVHTNSGVPNKMFYLLAKGGTSTHNSVLVKGITTDKAIGIAYRANMERWPHDASFQVAREGMIKAAIDIHGEGSLEVNQVRNAWAAVGVGPASPTILKATSNNANKVTLAWTDNSASETAFNIYRSVGTGAKSLLATVGPNVTSYADETATGNIATQTYGYSVEVCNSTVDGPDCSAPTSTAVVPYKAVNLTAVAGSPGQVNLTWTDKSANETGFTIQRKAGDCASSASWTNLPNTAANVTAATNSGLTSQSTYAYKVRAFARSATTPYAYGYSAWSACIAVTAP